jgi:hypothetical protein
MARLKKVELITTLFKAYQPMLNIVEQIALLTMWIEACVEKEEYEMAGALTKVMNYIQENPQMVPQRYEGELDKNSLLENNPLLTFDGEKSRVKMIKVISDDVERIQKPSIYKRIKNWFKRVFNGRFKKRI